MPIKIVTCGVIPMRGEMRRRTSRVTGLVIRAMRIPTAPIRIAKWLYVEM